MDPGALLIQSRNNSVIAENFSQGLPFSGYSTVFVGATDGGDAGAGGTGGVDAGIRPSEA